MMGAAPTLAASRVPVDVVPCDGCCMGVAASLTAGDDILGPADATRLDVGRTSVAGEILGAVPGDASALGVGSTLAAGDDVWGPGDGACSLGVG